MKRNYRKPIIKNFKVTSPSICNASIDSGGNGRNPVEAESKKFWGVSLLDNETNEDDNIAYEE